LRIAARRAQLGLPEVTLGLLPAMGATQRLPRLVGRSRAAELALSGARIDSAKALEWGLVNAVLDDDAFERGARAYAASIAAHAPLALMRTKKLLATADSRSPREHAEDEIS